MSAALLTRPRRGQRARLPALASRAASLGRRMLAPHRAALARLADIPLTVAGIGCIDVGVFTANAVAGWIVTGLSLMVLEHMIADEG